MTQVHDVFAFADWLDTAWAGDRCIYYEGHIARDREHMSPDARELVNYTRWAGTPQDAAVYRILPRLRERGPKELREEGTGKRGRGLGHLVQKRLGEDHYLYIFEKAS